ncbi:MAG: hypothetical protein EP329_05010 [Deltaproteobacteria bacterium]|nr:MAG: hypothetical protein EP329_05010 [Deltaproteobacteria bacterium]
MVRALALSCSLALTLTAVAGCDLVKTGDAGNLEFELVSTDRLVPFAFGTPLATGMSVDVKVYVADGTRTPAKINLAQPNDQTVAVVTGTSDGRFTLRAKVAGGTKVELVSAAGNDSFDLSVSDISKIVLLHPGRALVPQTPPVRVAQGGTARFPFTLQSADARQLVGYGALPVEVAPSTAAAAVTTDSTGLLSVDFDETGTVTLTPLGADPIEVTVVPATDITVLDFSAPDAGATRTVAVGQTTALVVEADNDLGEAILGLTGLGTTTTTTPEICTVAQAPLLGDAVFQVTGLKAGTCEVKAEYGALTASASVEVQ